MFWSLGYDISSLYAIQKSKTFPASLLNVCGLATSMFDLMLGQETATPSPASLT